MPSREQFMLLLHQHEALHIKASNRAAMTVSTLSDVRMIVARERTSVPPEALATADLAGAVEQCTCPPPYTGECCAPFYSIRPAGTSCQDCATGHYRLRATASAPLGACVPCQCNGHSHDCDVHTGE
jgi:hypothetical protein